MTITVGQVGSFAVADIFFSPLMQTPELGWADQICDSSRILHVRWQTNLTPCEQIYF
jgi:hypothetical protein